MALLPWLTGRTIAFKRKDNCAERKDQPKLVFFFSRKIAQIMISSSSPSSSIVFFSFTFSFAFFFCTFASQSTVALALLVFSPILTIPKKAPTFNRSLLLAASVSSQKGSHDANYTQLEPISTFAMRYWEATAVRVWKNCLTDKILQTEFYYKTTYLIFYDDMMYLK